MEIKYLLFGMISSLFVIHANWNRAILDLNTPTKGPPWTRSLEISTSWTG